MSREAQRGTSTKRQRRTPERHDNGMRGNEPSHTDSQPSKESGALPRLQSRICASFIFRAIHTTLNNCGFIGLSTANLTGLQRGGRAGSRVVVRSRRHCSRQRLQ